MCLMILHRKVFESDYFSYLKFQDLCATINVTEGMDRAGACLKSVLRIGVDKDHRTSNWVLILYQTCTTNKMDV